MRVWNSIQLIFTAIGGWIGWYMGGVDDFLIALIVFVALDYLTGVMCAIVNKRLSSEIGAKGIFKKVLIFGLVGLAHMIDKHVLGEGSTFRTATIFFYLSNEGISFLENASRLGLPIPEKLKDMLLQLTDKGGKKDAQ